MASSTIAALMEPLLPNEMQSQGQSQSLSQGPWIQGWPKGGPWVAQGWRKGGPRVAKGAVNSYTERDRDLVQAAIRSQRA